ncbi:MAG: thioredoxin domain-containing protein, partial [Solirubrobacteraceae bacterium]
MTNRLGAESSPYLLQHSSNPVDWYPWGEEAWTAARERNRPLLVSIGYSACHWCHVMAHECFEDPAVAAQMNAEFVCVKVDREERPDVDATCMEVCQAINGSGGWPLNVFLTPERTPFFAGTYFPPAPRQGMPSWPMVLSAIAESWRESPDAVREQGARMAQAISARAFADDGPQGALPVGLIDDCVAALRTTFDREHGGWGGAPKFPPHCTLELLLARGEDEMALQTLRAMAAGGIYDQVGGGFARYSVDGAWTVPHFEKMLYDNALLARTYLHAWQRSAEPRMAEVCCETLDWALRELRGEEGGFCCALDADSGGVEGAFYVWSEADLRDCLGELADAAIRYFGIRPGGNFEHAASVLEARGEPPARLPEIRCMLFGARARRVRPGLDDKRLTAWNALMLTALADAGAVLERADYVSAARACAAFILSSLRDEHGHLLRSWKDGRAAPIAGYLEDHAYLLQALLVLYEATFEERWYSEAVAVAQAMIKRFGDDAHGGFFTTAADQPHLVARRKDLEDTPTPSGNSAAALGLLRLARLSGESEYERWAEGVLRAHVPLAARLPGAFGQLLQALDLYLAPSREVAIIGVGDATLGEK